MHFTPPHCFSRQAQVGMTACKMRRRHMQAMYRLRHAGRRKKRREFVLPYPLFYSLVSRGSGYDVGFGFAEWRRDIISFKELGNGASLSAYFATDN